MERRVVMLRFDPERAELFQACDVCEQPLPDTDTFAIHRTDVNNRVMVVHEACIDHKALYNDDEVTAFCQGNPYPAVPFQVLKVAKCEFLFEPSVKKDEVGPADT
jgi:hypothetical protein